jgi:Zn-dependent protease with chaperone function
MLGYNLGRRLGPKLREANWIFRSLTGTEAEAIRAEVAVGRDLERAFLDQMEPSADPHARDLVAELGGRLAARVESREWRFRFRVVEAPEVNAFALPGGPVFLTRSLIQFCDQDRDELERLGAKTGDVRGLESYFSSHPPVEVRIRNVSRSPGR